MSLEPRLSPRAALLKPSPTLGITAKANAMRAAGENVLSFAAGEPDFGTPDAVNEAAIEAIRGGFSKYTPSAGTPDLRKAITEKLERENGLKYAPSQVIASCGAKQSVYNALQVLVGPGDEVILLAPYWMTYAEQVRLAGGEPVVVTADAKDGFVPSLDAIREAVTEKTRAIIVNSPSNPTGVVLPESLLKGIAELAEEKNFWIVADEIYERLVYSGAKAPSIAGFSPETYERTVTINGCSKAYAMTGWRIGYAAAPARVAQTMSDLQDQVTSNPTSFAQKGAVAALNLPASEIEAMRAEFEARRDLIVKLFREIPNAVVPEPQGAFYLFPDVSAYLDGDDMALAAHLLEKAKVAVVPGSVFGGPGCIRLSYATGRPQIEEGVGRIAEALHALR